MTAVDELDCSHCGLRLGRRAIDAEIGGVAGRYCCGGCVLAATVTRARGDPSVAAALLIRLGLAAFFAMNVMMLTLPTYASYVYGESGEGAMFVVFRWLAGGLTVPVLLLLGGPLVASARRGLARGRSSADLLIVLAVAAAFALSVTNLILGRPESYFDTTVMLLVLVTGGRFVEATAKARATEAIRRESSVGPQVARRVEGGDFEQVDPAELCPGDVVEVGPGHAFPADGIILDGEADVDESMLTGEASPQWKGVGDHVAGGTVSIDGRLRVRVERTAAESAQAQIETLLEEARTMPSELERSVDRAAGLVVPLVIAVAVAAGGYWGLTLGADRGVLAFVAVLVVACPCGLVLATPVAICRALSTATDRGIVVRSAAILERVAEVRRVLFDKTGTLTEAVPGIAAIEVRSGRLGPDELLARAAAVEDGIAHPIARAIVAEADRRGVPRSTARAVRLWPGRGASGLVDGVLVGVGTGPLFRELGLPRGGPDRVTIATAEGDEATLRLGEALVDGVEHTVQRLRNDGVSVGLVTGDRMPSEAVSRPFAPAEVRSGLGPEQKLAYVEELRRDFPDRIAMVGDGVNDAPALAAADVGVAVANATDLARLSADVVVLRGGAAAVPWLLAHGRRARRILRQNLFWAVVYNSAAVGLAAAGRLDPLIAATAMIGSSLLVLANSARLGGRTSGSVEGRREAGELEQVAVGEEPVSNARPATAS